MSNYKSFFKKGCFTVSNWRTLNGNVKFPSLCNQFNLNWIENQWTYFFDDLFWIVSDRIPQFFGIHSAESYQRADVPDVGFIQQNGWWRISRGFFGHHLLLQQTDLTHVEYVFIAQRQDGESQRIVHRDTHIDRHRRWNVILDSILHLLFNNITTFWK